MATKKWRVTVELVMDEEFEPRQGVVYAVNDFVINSSRGDRIISVVQEEIKKQ